MALKMVEATEAMADQLVAFHNSHYRDNRKREHWMWVYKGCYPDLAVFGAMTEGERIVGTQGLIPIFIRAAGERVLSGKPENSLVAPDHRGGNIYNDIYVYVKSEGPRKGMQCLWGYGPLYTASIKAGYTVFKHALVSLGAVIKPSAALSDARKTKKRGMKKFKEIAGRVFLWAYGTGLRATIASPNGAYTIRSEMENHQDMDDLYSRLRERYPDLIHIDLDEQYLKWRIDNNPFSKYKSYFVYKGTKLAAYSFVNAQAKTRAYLTDFTFDDENAAKFLLSTIIKDLRAQDVGLLIFLGNRENPLIKNTLDLLQRWGFMQFAETNFHIQNFNFQNVELFSNVKNWYMNGIGTEGNDI
jgi:hypothetical protein